MIPALLTALALALAAPGPPPAPDREEPRRAERQPALRDEDEAVIRDLDLLEQLELLESMELLDAPPDERRDVRER